MVSVHGAKTLEGGCAEPVGTVCGWRSVREDGGYGRASCRVCAWRGEAGGCADLRGAGACREAMAAPPSSAGSGVGWVEAPLCRVLETPVSCRVPELLGGGLSWLRAGRRPPCPEDR